MKARAAKALGDLAAPGRSPTPVPAGRGRSFQLTAR
jgi:hypothetical protein